MTPQEIEQDIIKNCEEAVAQGWRIVRNTCCLEHYKACCALGSLQALNLKWRSSSLNTVAAATYQMNEAETRNFVFGFDDISHTLYDCTEEVLSHPFYKMGQRIARKFIE